MTSDALRKAFSVFFVLGFFAYLFGPLIIMGLTAFNSSAFPRVAPWECFTVEWFDALAADTRLLTGLKNSLLIGFGVVCVAVPLGLCGALLLTQVSERVRPWYYTLLISPILVPGVVLGISTLLFWDRIGLMFGVARSSIFYNGFFLTIIGQSTFIAAYTMLVFISRLQRFDRTQEEAALDLGASHWQTFRKILVPFLKPAIASAAVLAFLASFENYNTTVFTAVSTSTLTTVLASKVRYGINPSISALAVVIVVITLIGAAVHEVLKRRELAAQGVSQRMAAKGVASGAGSSSQRALYAEPGLVMIFLVVVAGLGTTYLAGTRGVAECKVEVKEQKRIATQARIEALREKAQARRAKQREQQQSEQTERARRTGTENFNSIFNTDNLAPSTELDTQPESATPRVGTENFGGMFTTDNLAPAENSRGSEIPKSEQQTVQPTTPPADKTEARTGTENFNGVFQLHNLTPGGN